MHFDDSKNDAVRLITLQKFDGKVKIRFEMIKKLMRLIMK